MKKTLQIVAALALAAVLLWLTFDLEDSEGRSIPLSTILANLREARPAYLLAGMAVGVAHVVVRSLRWRTLLTPVRPRVSFYPLFATTSLGYAASLVGGRVGEVLRPALLGLRERLPIAATIGSVVVERFLDLVALVMLAAMALMAPRAWSGLVVGSDLKLLRSAGAVALTAGLVALATMALMAARRERIEAWAEAHAAANERSFRGIALSLLSRFLHGAEALRRPSLLVSSALQSLGVWVVIGVGVWLLLLGCGVGIPLVGVFVMVPALALGIAVPTPGGAGSYHLMMRKTLESFYGVDPALAASASLLHHAATWVPMIVVAVVIMGHEGLGIRELSRAARTAAGGSR